MTSRMGTGKPLTFFNSVAGDDGFQTLRSLYSAGSMRPQVDSTQLASSPELTDRLAAVLGEQRTYTI